MNARFFFRLAFENIKSNGRLYGPYTIAVSGMVAMFYIVQSIYQNQALLGGGMASLRSMMGFGCVVTAIFVVIFLFYTNGFFVKKRSREFALYGILGLEKKHVGFIMLIETVMLYAACLIAGLAVGILFSKAMFLLLLRILGADAAFGFEIPAGVIGVTALLFALIFIAAYIRNLYQIHLSKPVELLNAGKVGEREPRVKWPVVVLGVACLGGGYSVALMNTNPLAAIGNVFLAIVLIIAGTYLTFSAGSIALLKYLRKNKKYYYQTRHFISVSGMIYRMRQNAAGLASICVLSTAVLVILSTTISMYVGMSDVLRTRFPRDIAVQATAVTGARAAEIDAAIARTLQSYGVSEENAIRYQYRFFLVKRGADGAFGGSGGSSVSSGSSVSNGSSVSGGSSVSNGSNGSSGNAQESSQTSSAAWWDYINLVCIPVSEYSRMQDSTETLSENEALLYDSQGTFAGDTVKLGGLVYQVKERIETLNIEESGAARTMESYYLIVPDDAIGKIAVALGGGADGGALSYYRAFDVEAPAEVQIALADAIQKDIGQGVGQYNGQSVGQAGDGNNFSFTVESVEAARGSMLATYGGLLFLGVFLGGLFIAATILIIYYKQISEGYHDHERFSIMQQVGLTRAEVRSAIRSQVLTVFYLPLCMSAVHIFALFNIITKLLAILNLTNTGLFAICAIAVLLAFAALYTAIYAATARAYYRIVGERG